MCKKGLTFGEIEKIGELDIGDLEVLVFELVEKRVHEDLEGFEAFARGVLEDLGDEVHEVGVGLELLEDLGKEYGGWGQPCSRGGS